MSEFIVKILKTNFLTHDVKRFIVEKPHGYTYLPGQATDVSIQSQKWKDELRPFTFTSLPDAENLEFTIKIYRDHDGVTNQLGRLNEGSELIVHDVFGAIQYKGKGIFIAGGAGITPFIAIFRDLHRRNELYGNKLFFSNKTTADVILEEELTQMLGADFIRVFTRQASKEPTMSRIDEKFLKEKIQDIHQLFYVCGPDPFVQEISGLLTNMGASAQAVVFEQ